MKPARILGVSISLPVKLIFFSMVTLLAGFQNGKVSLSVGGVEDDGHYRLPLSEVDGAVIHPGGNGDGVARLHVDAPAAVSVGDAAALDTQDFAAVGMDMGRVAAAGLQDTAAECERAAVLQGSARMPFQPPPGKFLHPDRGLFQDDNRHDASSLKSDPFRHCDMDVTMLL